MGVANFFFFPFSIWYWFGQFTHLGHKPPIPLIPEYQYVNARKRDFSFHGGRWNDCKECRWLEFECKKLCHDRLKDEGRNVWGLARPPLSNNRLPLRATEARHGNRRQKGVHAISGTAPVPKSTGAHGHWCST